MPPTRLGQRTIKEADNRAAHISLVILKLMIDSWNTTLALRFEAVPHPKADSVSYPIAYNQKVWQAHNLETHHADFQNTSLGNKPNIALVDCRIPSHGPIKIHWTNQRWHTSLLHLFWLVPIADHKEREKSILKSDFIHAHFMIEATLSLIAIAESPWNVQRRATQLKPLLIQS